MMIFRLQAHVSTPCQWIDSFDVTVQRGHTGALQCRYELRGDMSRLAIPRQVPMPDRTDGLWRHTCLEVFIRRPQNTTYAEFNFSPSGQWAAYLFERYREGMTNFPLDSAPAIVVEANDQACVVTSTLLLPAFAGQPLEIGLSAVIESRDGTIHYWALRHAPDKPDFHHEASFAGQLPA